MRITPFSACYDIFWLDIIIAHLAEYCLQYFAFQVFLHILAFNSFLHYWHHIAVCRKRIFDILVSVAITYIMEACPQYPAFDHLLLHQGFYFQTVPGFRRKGYHGAAVKPNTAGILIH